MEGKFKGDDFPNTEAFISDRRGQKISLGADVRSRRDFEDNTAISLYGGETQEIMYFKLKIGLDNNGNFTSIICDGEGHDNHGGAGDFWVPINWHNRSYLDKNPNRRLVNKNLS